MSMEARGRLLLVEDENVLRGLVQEFLALERYDVEAAADGQEAIDAYAERGPYDLVLMDLNLPRVPGVEACRQIKRMNQRQPVLVCSAAILDSHAEALHQIGVHDTLTKPYHPSDLVGAVRRILAEPRPEAPTPQPSWRDHQGHAAAGPNAAGRLAAERPHGVDATPNR